MNWIYRLKREFLVSFSSRGFYEKYRSRSLPGLLQVFFFIFFIPLAFLYCIGATFSCYTRFVRLEKCARTSRGTLAKGECTKPKLISIGNIAVGGRGKTPVTLYIAKALQRQGCHVALVMRGIGRDKSTNSHNKTPPAWTKQLASQNACLVPNISIGEETTKTLDDTYRHAVNFFGDEAVMCASELGSNCVVIAPKDRLAGMKYVSGLLKPDVILFDDALQCHQINMDLNIVLLGPFDLWPTLPVLSFLRYLPWGTQRIASSFLCKTDYILFQNHFPNPSSNKQGLVFNDCFTEVQKRAAQEPALALLMQTEKYSEFSYQPLFFSQIESTNTSNPCLLKLQRWELQEWCLEIKNKHVAAVCAIANPASFLETLKLIGCNLTKTFVLPDHGLSTSSEWRALCQQAYNRGITHIVITEKDATKLKAQLQVMAEFPALKFFSLHIQLQCGSGLDNFLSAFVRDIDSTADAAGECTHL